MRVLPYARVGDMGARNRWVMAGEMYSAEEVC